MEEFLRRRAVSLIAAFCGKTHTCRAAAKHHANRSTVVKKVGRLTAARKNDTSAETYGEPQPLRTHGSLAQPPTSGNGLYTAAEASR